MKFSIAVALLVTNASAELGSPIAKVIQMISDLEAKLISEGEASQKVYGEFERWCGDTSSNLRQEVKTKKREVAGLKATIEKEGANIVVQESILEEVASSTASNEQALKSATEIRFEENNNFQALEQELSETVDILERAIGIIEREMDGGASMMQMKNAGNVAQVLSMMVKAESLSFADGKRLTEFIQSQSSDDSDDDIIENQSGSVLDTLNSILEKAQTQLDAARSKEQGDLHTFEMVKMSLEDKIKFANKKIAKAKKSRAESVGSKALASGDLEVTSKDLTNDASQLSELHYECMTKANEFEQETTSRGEELTALATAKKIVIEATSSSTSFLQMFSNSAGSHGIYEITHSLRELARTYRDPMLSQLTSRVEAQIKYGHGSKSDIFAKIKESISAMIAELEAEAAADATEKAYCDKNLAESNQKKVDKADEIESLSAKIQQLASESQQLKDQVAVLHSEITEVVSSQAKMDEIRQQEQAQYDVNKAEVEKAVTGIKLALKVLNEYYAKKEEAAHQHGDVDGTSSGIINLLEHCEADFSKSLAEMNQIEETSARDYEEQTKANEITKAAKEQDIKYKTKEFKGFDKTIVESESDKADVASELDAVSEYLRQLNSRCGGKVASYEDRKSRREHEIQGLKDGLATLEAMTPSAFVQVHSARSLRLRGPIRLR